MIARKHAAITLLVAPLVIAAAFVGCCTLASGCFLWNQEPVCPPSKPACLNDHDPVIWQGDQHGAGRDAGVMSDVSDARDARKD